MQALNVWNTESIVGMGSFAINFMDRNRRCSFRFIRSKLECLDGYTKLNSTKKISGVKIFSAFVNLK